MTPKPGYIYIVFNTEMPNCIKLGLTTRTPADRLKELSSGTSVAGQFRLLKAWQVTDTATAEREAQKSLVNAGMPRTETNREHFKTGTTGYPRAMSVVGTAVRPYLVTPISDEIRDQIKKDCDELSQFLFTTDHSVEPWAKVSPKVTEKLRAKCFDYFIYEAECFQEIGVNPSILSSIIDLAIGQLEGPPQYELSLDELARELRSGVRTLTTILYQCSIPQYASQCAAALNYSSEMLRVISLSLTTLDEDTEDDG